MEGVLYLHIPYMDRSPFAADTISSKLLVMVEIEFSQRPCFPE